MKKIFMVLIVSFLILGITLNAKNAEKTIMRNVNGLAPRQLSGISNHEQMVFSNVNRDPDSRVYAFNAYDPNTIIPVGPVTFILNDPAGLTSLAASTAPYLMAGACWLAETETWYCTQYGGGLYTIDPATGTMTYIADSIGLNSIETDDSGIMYGTDGSNLYTVDWTTGATMLIGSHNIGFAMAGIACDDAGNMYGLSVDGEASADLYLIALDTGIATSLGSTGAQLCYAQDMAYDKNDGVLYAAAYFGDGTPSGLYSIDTNTAAMTLIGDFPDGIEVAALAIPYILAEPGAPAAPADVVVTPDGNGGLNCDLSWTCPDLTFGGDPLTELLEMRVYREGILVYSDSNPIIGGAGNCSDFVTAAGVYIYEVVGYNSEGESPAEGEAVWIGEDIPDAVIDFTLTDVSTEDLIAQLDWTNPITGFHGGYFAGITGYNIERSDGTLFSLAGSTTTWQDVTIVDPGIYAYSIIPYNSIGLGPSTTSYQVGIGIDIAQVGNTEVGDFYIPLNLWFMDSIVEVVYLQEWLETGMIINTVSFHAATISTMTDACDLEIWLGETPEDDLTAGWIPGADLEQVFSGTIDVAPGDHWLEIPLDEDFYYGNYENLVMMIIRNDNENYSFNDLWWCTESGTPNRTRLNFSDNETGWGFNALTGPWWGTETKTIYPDVRFYYTPLIIPSPGAATDVTFAADPDGALETQIDWTCPTLNYSGTTLTELLEMRVYRDSLLIYTDNSPTIGGTGSYLDAAVPLSGLNEYRVVGYNSEGEGIPVNGEPWIGEDIPAAVDNFALAQTSPNTLSGTLTWENPATGFHGGPFNEPILGYHIVRSDSMVFELEGSVTTYIDDTIPITANYCYTIVPYNLIGDGPIMTSNSVLIADNGLLIWEDFSNTVPPEGWHIADLGQNNWSSSATSRAGGAAPEAWLDWIPVFSGISRLCSDTLDTSGMNTLTLEFKHRVYDYEGGYTLGVATSTDGTTWNDVWTTIPTGSTPPATVIVDITNVDVGSATFQFCFYFAGESYDIDWWYLDDVILTDNGPLVASPENIVAVINTELSGNYPNPFNPDTNIAFSLKEAGHVTLEVYNIRGQLVKTLVNEVRETGFYLENWKGRDDSNKSVASGVYFYKMKSGDYHKSKKMLLIK
ncbi:MAG: T9SS type A sorting domain-containing protein [Candidatus Cloacimonetes bacterium]|nr:T9SS type A sorting domain-containing protein [Candidatus Cloacimonadota bacterium]MCF7815061.1 T9SS type A sorting domain-containing protein [Candidatus Cloacimonadota bacterium]MCF7867993.1 T9SS type A sorting domain-containing protein [Candidatus Cloacimonadota bacterium]MCF7883451.1 T9SS type A sorting domain-containing protein [Candidatus Cloacimonadota bacterium]